MKETRISEYVTIGPQPTTIEEFEVLQFRGFRTIFCLSRKGELDQILKPEEEERLAEDAGIEFVHLPVSLNTLKYDHVDEFVHEVREHEMPTYIHCRIGQRSAPFALLFHALRRGMDAERVLMKARELNLKWRAPMITDFMKNYLARAQQKPVGALAA